MSIRLKDIAQDLNVSVVTVSKVLRNHFDIGEATRERVLRRMKELNYRPNLAARTLVTGRTYMVGLVVPGLVHPFFAAIAKEISKEIRPHGYSLVIASSEEDPALERQEIDLLLARQVDALIIASAQATVESFLDIESRNVPYLLIDRQLPGVCADFIGIDDELAGFLATEHLIQEGYQRIAHIRGPALSNGVARYAGFARALRAHGCKLQPQYVVAGTAIDDCGDVSGFDAMNELLKQDPRPDAVFCFNDPAAIGAMKAVLEAGLRIPGDIALMGVGNTRHSELLRVALSTVDQDSTAIGMRAAHLALKLINAKTKPKQTNLILKPALVIRESSRRA